jgi:FMN phosphatase YigB (HAD superfamily)
MPFTYRSTVLAAALFLIAAAMAVADPLPSWNDTAPKKAIIAFVERVTREGSPDFVKPEERIATFDNDGTLWVEQPNYTQVTFAIDEVIAKAPQHPEWRETEPFKSIIAHDREAMLRFSIQDFEKVVAVTHSGMTIQQFQEIVKKWLAEAKHPRFKRPYTECVYQPMLELMQYLRANGFKTYIDGARLMMLVHHDDARREYAYGAESKIGTFSDALMAEAKKKGWIVISMKDDWKQIFAFEK